MDLIPVDLVLLIIPGLISAKVYFNLTRMIPPSVVDYLAYSLGFGIGGYSIVAVAEYALPGLVGANGKVLLANDLIGNESITWRRLVMASIASVTISLSFVFVRNRRWLNKFAVFMKISNMYSSDSTFSLAMRESTNKLVRIKRETGKIYYEGQVVNFHEFPSRLEIYMVGVVVGHYEEEYYDELSKVFLTLPATEQHTIEFISPKPVLWQSSESFPEKNQTKVDSKKVPHLAGSLLILLLEKLFLRR